MNPVLATPPAGATIQQGDPLAGVPGCPEDASTPLFTTLPMALDHFHAFRPLGFLSPPIHMLPAKHSSFSVNLPGAERVSWPLVAPGKIWVMEVWEVSNSSGLANYQVFAYPCREVRVYFGHVATISDRLTEAMGRTEANCNSFNDSTTTITTCRHTGLGILLEAGEALGTGPDTAGVDLGLVDFRRVPAGFVNPEHYDYYYPYYASPLDYFSAEARVQLASKTGSVFGDRMRTAEPIGGSYMQDIGGTAQGIWFSPGRYHSNSTDLSSALSLAHDYVDPTQPVLAVGNSIPGLNQGLYAFAPQPEGRINRAFSDITSDGQVYCYEDFLAGQSPGRMPLSNADGVLLLTMPTETTLTIEFVAAPSCSDVTEWAFTSNASGFER